MSDRDEAAEEIIQPADIGKVPPSEASPSRRALADDLSETLDPSLESGDDLPVSHGGLLQPHPKRPAQHSKDDERQKKRLAGEYDDVRDELLTDTTNLRQKTATQFTPRFKAKIAERWKAIASENHEEQRQLGEWIINELERLALVLWCPKTRLPAKLRIIGRGDFQIVPHGWKNSSISRSDLVELLPYIYLMPAGSPGPMKAEQYATRSPDRSSSRER